MRIRPFFFLSAFCLPMLLPAAPARYIHLKPGSASAIFLPGEPIAFDIEVPAAKIEHGEFEVVNFQGKAVFRAAWGSGGVDASKRANATPFGTDQTTSASIISLRIRGEGTGKTLVSKSEPFKRFGVFRVRLDLVESGTPDAETDETTFARIPDVRLRGLQPDSPFGIGAYYAMRFNPEELAEASNIEQLMGAAWERDELLWDIVEPEPGKWTWGKTDRAVRAAHQHHIEILGLLDYWGKWAKPFTDKGYEAYAKYVKTVVERYKPGGKFARSEGWADGYGIRNWEIWNEPATFWSGSGQQFGRLLKEANQAAKSADPNCRVFFSEAGREFNAAVVKASGLDAFDGITPHYYCPPRSPEEGGMGRNMKKTVADFAALGVKGRPFWVSEFGWPSTMDPGEMRNQAIYLVRSYIYGSAAEMNKFFWYNFVNDDRIKNHSHFGLINREDWTPRFGFGAYTAMVHFLGGAAFAESVDLMRPAHIFVFSKKKGSVAVLWSSGAKGSLHANLPREAAAFDLMGNRLASASMKETRSGSSIKPGAQDLPLGESPIYLISEGTDAAHLASALRSGKVTGISAAEVEILPFAGPVKAHLPVRVRVTNQGRKPIQGTVVLSGPEGWKIEGAKAERAVGPIPPDGVATVSFSFAETRPSADNRYPFRASFRDRTGNEAVARAILSALVAPRGTPTIDGDARDWAGVPRVHLDTSDKAVGLVPYMDWNLSTDIATMWDDHNFYFLGEVRDNIFSEPYSGSVIWQGDSFQIAFDTRPDRAAGNADHATERNPLHRVEENYKKENGLYLYGLAHTPIGDEAWSWPVPGNPGDRDASSIRFVFRQTGVDRYVYEAAIPKPLLAPLEFKEGAKFGFTLLLNDNDGGGRRGWLELTPGIGTGYQPKQFLTWTLVGPR